MLTQFEFLGFTPESELRASVNQVLRDVLDFAPSDAISSASLEKRGNSYYCSIDIYSSSEEFHIRAQDFDPGKAVAEVERNLLERIIAWRRERFREDDIRRAV